ncbi:hypothetical protein HDU93_009375, partial [Gonapodya sp. JEL0774]
MEKTLASQLAAMRPVAMVARVPKNLVHGGEPVGPVAMVARVPKNLVRGGEPVIGLIRQHRGLGGDEAAVATIFPAFPCGRNVADNRNRDFIGTAKELLTILRLTQHLPLLENLTGQLGLDALDCAMAIAKVANAFASPGRRLDEAAVVDAALARDFTIGKVRLETPKAETDLEQVTRLLGLVTAKEEEKRREASQPSQSDTLLYVVCFDDKRETVFTPCGHMVCCVECSGMVKM